MTKNKILTTKECKGLKINVPKQNDNIKLVKEKEKRNAQFCKHVVLFPNVFISIFKDGYML